ncbi:MAG: DUF2798 domain-containing protein [Nitratireductor sp.]|nr:DUF2798 domain-containing protein [Nitratireductor sp.]
MKPFLPGRYEHYVFGLLLTCFMTFFVSGISTIMAIGLDAGKFAGLWFRAWMTTWVIAYPIFLFVAPVVRRILHRIVVTQGG